MEQMNVGVIVDDLLVAFCLLFVGGPGFCATSPETRSLAAIHCGDAHVSTVDGHFFICEEISGSY